MMKNEKLWDFKTQEQKIQTVWNIGIYNVGIKCVVQVQTYSNVRKKLDYGRWHTQDSDKVRAAASVFVKEQKPIGLDGCFISYVLCIDYSLSCGMELCIPSIQTLLFNSFPMDCVPSKFP